MRGREVHSKARAPDEADAALATARAPTLTGRVVGVADGDKQLKS